MQVSEFNKRYNIGENLQDKIKYLGPDHIQHSSNIAGKPKKMLVEIVKRFFKNPYVVIAFFVFVALILCSIIIPLTTPFKPNQAINDYDKAFILLLPPKYAPLKTLSLSVDDRVLTSYWDILKLVNEHPELDPSKTGALQTPFADLIKTAKEGAYNSKSKTITFTYDTYAMFKSNILKIELLKLLDTNPTMTFAQSDIDKVLNSLPPAETLLGTDKFGIDIWTSSWAATAESIKIALAVSVLQTIIGVAIGAYLGFHVGKWIDTIFMRIIEIFLAPPGLIWLLLFVSILGVSNTALVLALVITGWAWPVSGTRMFIITVKDEEYITAAKSIGASTSRQVFMHALPAILGKIATSFVRQIPSVILSVASLAFLGFYKDANTNNLGQLLLDATPQAPDNFWILLLPSLILLFLSLSLQFIAIGVHDALDPKVIGAKK